MKEDIGDFEEVVEGKPLPGKPGEPFASTRVRLPRGPEQVGTIMQRLGGNRMNVHMTSGKQMNCRVPGRFKRSLWLREKDVVLVEPWEFDAEKGDVVYKYSSSEIMQLRKRGLLKEQQNTF